MEFSELQYPSMREELIDYLQGLSDFGYQCRAWVNGDASGRPYDEFGDAIHFLFDDTSLATDARSWIGVILLGEEEVQVVEAVVMSLDALFGEYGTELADVEYMQKTEWMNVVECSKQALAVFMNVQ